MGDFVDFQARADRPGSASVQRSAMLEVWMLNQWILAYKAVFGKGLEWFRH